MYDELVKELREAEKRAKVFGRNPYRYVPYYGKAADAIEELSVKYEKALQDLVKQAEPPKEE